MDYSPPGSSTHGILQARILEWAAIPPPGDLPNPVTEPASVRSPALTGGFFTTSITWEAHTWKIVDPQYLSFEQMNEFQQTPFPFKVISLSEALILTLVHQEVS